MNEVKSPKKPLLYYYVVALLVVMLFNFIAMPWMAEHQIKEVDYNTFVTMTEQGEVGKVEIQQQDNRILFTSADEKTVYKTAMVPDDGLVQRREKDEQKQRQRDAEDDRRADDNLRRLLGLEVLFYPLVELVRLLILNGHKLRRVGQRLHTLDHGIQKRRTAADERPAEYGVSVPDEFQLLDLFDKAVRRAAYDGLLFRPAHEDTFDKSLSADGCADSRHSPAGRQSAPPWTR